MQVKKRSLILFFMFSICAETIFSAGLQADVKSLEEDMITRRKAQHGAVGGYEHLYEICEKCYQNGEYHEAIIRIKALLKKNPDNENAKGQIQNCRRLLSPGRTNQIFPCRTLRS